MNTQPDSLSHLNDSLRHYFSADELRILAAKLDFFDLPEALSKENIVSRLVQYASHRQNIPELVALIKAERPKLALSLPSDESFPIVSSAPKPIRPQAMTAQSTLTILHLSDIQFGKHHRFGVDTSTLDAQLDTLQARLNEDLNRLKKTYGLKPDLIIFTGDLAEWGKKQEFDAVLTFIEGVIAAQQLSRDRVVLVPGNHDINRSRCEAYFKECEAEDESPKEPFWPKWKDFKHCFDSFYQDVPAFQFIETQPWTLFELPALKVVVAGLNSTMKESHRDSDHYGWLGEGQLKWFQEQLEVFKQQGWLRIGAIHHNVRRGAKDDDENLHDTDDLKRILSEQVNLLLHGHTHDGMMDWLTNKVPILATGSAALKTEIRPDEVPNQYQLIQISAHGLKRWCRAYSPKQKDWIGDNQAIMGGNDWQQEEEVDFVAVAATFPEVKKN